MKLLVGVLVFSTALFACLFLFRPRIETREIIREVPHEIIREVTVTKEVKVPVEVVKEVPVEKIVQVEKPIPADYQAAYELGRAIQNAGDLPDAADLTGVPSVRVLVLLQPAISAYVNKDAIKTRIELTLRQSGIPIRADSEFTLIYSILAVKPEAAPIILISPELQLIEPSVLNARSSRYYRDHVRTWFTGWVGSVPTSNTQEQMLEVAKTFTEEFANAWLASNQKK